MAEFEMPEKARSRHERIVGLIIAAIAVILAIVSSAAIQSHSNEILAHVDASDQYSFYQAKRQRFAALELASDNADLYKDRLSPAEAQREADLAVKYLKEMQRLGEESKAIQAKGDEWMKEAARLERKSRILDVAEIALQISIVLCSITIVTEQRLFALMGSVTAIVGLAVGLWGMLAG
jgi:hypothetical protein